MSDQNLQRLLAANSLDELYPVLSEQRMTPGWHKKRASLWPAPRTEFQPLHWRYELGRTALDQAGRWIGTELAERRNLLLFNPVGDNDYDSVRTLVCAFQMLKPGEHARAHRHTPNAMRFVLDAEDGCFSVVDGVKVPMHPGDVLLTPASAWHSHYNEGSRNAYWIDILDVPLVHLLEPMFFEEHPERYQPIVSEPQSHPFYHPHARNMQLLDAAAATGGVRRVQLDTANEIRTFDIGFVGLQAGARRAVPRTTASRIIVVGKGRGIAQVGELRVNWSRGDVLAVPSWTPFEFEAQEDSVLMEVTDTPVLRALGFYKEQ
jgi:gentisate 1,2-dioxygenase